MSSSMTGTKRSTNVKMDKSNSYTRPCPRCGLVRNVRKGREHLMCVDCKVVDPGWPDSVAAAFREVS